METLVFDIWQQGKAQVVGWDRYLRNEFRAGYMAELSDFLAGEREEDVYPERGNWFAAFQETPFEEVKVVILGQDPYFNPGQAHGLSFSIPREQKKIPSSLNNIFKELNRDLHFEKPSHGCLRPWAQQGVLLLNTVLTVHAGNARSHYSKGWEYFTTTALRALEEHGKNIVFLAWGKDAQVVLAKAGITKEKYAQNDAGKHRLLIASHPSGLSAYRTDTPFLGRQETSGCRHFSRANQYLVAHEREAINWQLPE